MIEIDKLKKMANSLMFDMTDEEYLTLQEEFNTILKQMDLIDKIEGIDGVSPMTFPFDVTYQLKDNNMESITSQEAFSNAKSVKNNRVEVPKVVG